MKTILNVRVTFLIRNVPQWLPYKRYRRSGEFQYDGSNAWENNTECQASLCHKSQDRAAGRGSPINISYG